MSNDNSSVPARLHNVEEAAKLCGSVSPWTIRKHISRGTVQVTRIGRRVFVPSEEIERIRREGLPSLGAPLAPASLAESQEISQSKSR